MPIKTEQVQCRILTELQQVRKIERSINIINKCVCHAQVAAYAAPQHKGFPSGSRKSKINFSPYWLEKNTSKIDSHLCRPLSVYCLITSAHGLLTVHVKSWVMWTPYLSFHVKQNWQRWRRGDSGEKPRAPWLPWPLAQAMIVSTHSLFKKPHSWLLQPCSLLLFDLHSGTQRLKVLKQVSWEKNQEAKSYPQENCWQHGSTLLLSLSLNLRFVSLTLSLLPCTSPCLITRQALYL